jgi:hypothetical protein
MVAISGDYLSEVFKKQLQQKRDDTIKSIDNSLQTALDLKNADKDIIFSDISDYFIQEFSTTLTTIENIIKALYPKNVPDVICGILLDIKSYKLYCSYLSMHSNNIDEYQQIRNEVIKRWIKD